MTLEERVALLEEIVLLQKQYIESIRDILTASIIPAQTQEQYIAQLAAIAAGQVRSNRWGAEMKTALERIPSTNRIKIIVEAAGDDGEEAVDAITALVDVVRVQNPEASSHITQAAAVGFQAGTEAIEEGMGLGLAPKKTTETKPPEWVDELLDEND